MGNDHFLVLDDDLVLNLRDPLLHTDSLVANSTADVDKEDLLWFQIVRLFFNRVGFHPGLESLLLGLHVAIEMAVVLRLGLEPEEGRKLCVVR